MMKVILKKLVVAGVIGAFLAQLAACGTLMYPERKGQKDGKIDPQVAILDGIGLLFFLIPGVIAFAVDFSNGTIYLPGTQTTSFNWHDSLRVVKVEGELDLDKVERIVSEETGLNIDLNSDAVQTKKMDAVPELETKVAYISSQRKA